MCQWISRCAACDLTQKVLCVVWCQNGYQYTAVFSQTTLPWNVQRQSGQNCNAKKSRMRTGVCILCSRLEKIKCETKTFSVVFEKEKCEEIPTRANEAGNYRVSSFTCLGWNSQSLQLCMWVILEVEETFVILIKISSEFMPAGDNASSGDS